MIDGGKRAEPGKPVIVPRSPWCRRSTPASSKGKLTAGKAVIDLARAGASPAAVPVPTIDGGQLGKLVIVPRSSTWQGAARGADDRRRPVPRASRRRASRSSTWQAPGPSRGRARADDRRRATRQAGHRADVPRGHRPGNVPRSPWCRRSTPGKRAESGQGGHRPGKRRGLPAAVPVVPTIDAGKPGHRPGSAGAFPRPCPC